MLRNFGTIFSNTYRRNAAVAALHSASSAKHIEVVEKDGVREIVMNQPKIRNPLSMSVMETILKELTRNTNDEQLRAIVLSSRGPVWSAGHNLKELANDPSKQLDIFNKLIEIILCIYQLPVPVIAKVNGLAAAAGCQLVASCDLVVCSDKSTFSTPGANVGIFCTTPGIAISRVMPRLKASYMLFTSLPITAQEAYAGGLVSSMVPVAELDAEMEKITDSIKTKSRAVMALGKQFYYQQMNLGVRDAYSAGAEKMIENLSLEDGREGVKSFVEKRKPKWTHK